MPDINQRTKTYLQELYESFVHVRGYAFAVSGLILGIVYFEVSKSDTISLKLVIPIGAFLFLLLITFVDMSYRMHGRALKTMPAVMQARKAPALLPEACALLLLEPSDLYGYEALTSIYYSDDGFEVLIGLGFVFTVQNNGLIQIVVTKIIEDKYCDLWREIHNNNKNVLAKLLVKPTAPKHLLLDIIEGRK